MHREREREKHTIIISGATSGPTATTSGTWSRGRTGRVYMRNLLGRLETRLASNTLDIILQLFE